MEVISLLTTAPGGLEISHTRSINEHSIDRLGYCQIVVLIEDLLITALIHPHAFWLRDIAATSILPKIDWDIK